MDYQKVYNQLIAKRRANPINRKDGDCEYHHIVPICMDGEKTPRSAKYNHEGTNLIGLTTKEHIFAHIVLTKIYPDNEKLLDAAKFMTDRFHQTSRVAAQLRKKAAEAHGESMKGKNNPMYGRHHSEESKRKNSETHKGKHLSEEHRRKLSESCSEAMRGENNPMYGKHLSEETRRKISESLKGEKHHFYGKHHSTETRQKMSESQKGKKYRLGKHHSTETRQKMSESQKGKKYRLGKHHSTETRQKLSEANKRWWQQQKLRSQKSDG